MAIESEAQAASQSFRYISKQEYESSLLVASEFRGRVKEYLQNNPVKISELFHRLVQHGTFDEAFLDLFSALEFRVAFLNEYMSHGWMKLFPELREKQIQKLLSELSHSEQKNLSLLEEISNRNLKANPRLLSPELTLALEEKIKQLNDFNWAVTSLDSAFNPKDILSFFNRADYLSPEQALKIIESQGSEAAKVSEKVLLKYFMNEKSSEENKKSAANLMTLIREVDDLTLEALQNHFKEPRSDAEYEAIAELSEAWGVDPLGIGQVLRLLNSSDQSDVLLAANYIAHAPKYERRLATDDILDLLKKAYPKIYFAQEEDRMTYYRAIMKSWLSYHMGKESVFLEKEMAYLDFVAEDASTLLPLYEEMFEFYHVPVRERIKLLELYLVRNKGVLSPLTVQSVKKLIQEYSMVYEKPQEVLKELKGNRANDLQFALDLHRTTKGNKDFFLEKEQGEKSLALRYFYFLKSPEPKNYELASDLEAVTMNSAFPLYFMSDPHQFSDPNLYTAFEYTLMPKIRASELNSMVFKKAIEDENWSLADFMLMRGYVDSDLPRRLLFNVKGPDSSFVSLKQRREELPSLYLSRWDSQLVFLDALNSDNLSLAKELLDYEEKEFLESNLHSYAANYFLGKGADLKKGISFFNRLGVDFSYLLAEIHELDKSFLYRSSMLEVLMDSDVELKDKERIIYSLSIYLHLFKSQKKSLLEKAKAAEKRRVKKEKIIKESI